MSDRSRTPTGDSLTSIYDPARAKRPTAKQRADSLREAQRRREVEMATPTEVSPRFDRSEPIQVISMKTPGVAQQAPRPPVVPAPHVVQLRALSEISGQHRELGRLAPPRDPREVRSRRVRDYLIWGSVVVIVGCAVMLAVWFIARR